MSKTAPVLITNSSALMVMIEEMRTTVFKTKASVTGHLTAVMAVMNSIVTMNVMIMSTSVSMEPFQGLNFWDFVSENMRFVMATKIVMTSLMNLNAITLVQKGSLGVMRV